MDSLHLVFDGQAEWYFYAIFLIFFGAIGYSGFLTIEALFALFGLPPLRRLARQTSVPTTAITTIVWVKTVSRAAFCIFVICGTWVVLVDNFGCFRKLDITATSIRLSYNWPRTDSDILLSSIRSIALEPVRRSDFKHPYSRLEIVTGTGTILRSIKTNDKLVLTNCQRVINNFYQR